MALRRVHKFGHVPELLITFGLSYLIFQLVNLVWGRQALNFVPPVGLRDALFTITQSPGRGVGLAWGMPPMDCARMPGEARL